MTRSNDHAVGVRRRAAPLARLLSVVVLPLIAVQSAPASAFAAAGIELRSATVAADGDGRGSDKTGSAANSHDSGNGTAGQAESLMVLTVLPPPSTLPGATTCAGCAITVTFTGFKPFSRVTITLRSPAVVLGTFTADANGIVTVTVTIPADTIPGNYTIVASGIDRGGSPRVQSMKLVVTPKPSTTVTSTGGGELAHTGAGLPMMEVSMALLSAGGGLIFAAYRRRRSQATRSRG